MVRIWENDNPYGAILVLAEHLAKETLTMPLTQTLTVVLTVVLTITVSTIKCKAECLPSTDLDPVKEMSTRVEDTMWHLVALMNQVLNPTQLTLTLISKLTRITARTMTMILTLTIITCILTLCC